MDFKLSHEQQLIFGYGANVAEKFNRAYWLDNVREKSYPEALWRQLGEDGFLGALVPESYGGAGLGMTEMALLTEGLADQGLPLFLLITGATIAMPVIAEFGSDAHRHEILPQLCRGEKRICFAISEDTAGANPYQLKCRARKTKVAGKQQFILTGEKNYTSGADSSDYAIVVTRTLTQEEAANKHHGFTLFLLDLNHPAIEKQVLDVGVPMPLKECNLYFNEVELGPENVIGEVDMGMLALGATTNAERIVTAAMSIGLGRFMTRKGAAYANDREVFTGPIAAYQAVQHPLASARTLVEQSRLMTLKAAWLFDAGEHADEAANMAKYSSAEAAMAASEAALQCHGAAGFTMGMGVYDIYQVCRLLRSAPVSRERALCFIAERTLGMPRSY